MTVRRGDGGLPLSPFTLLRVSRGMLLGVEEYRTLIGHGRGKHLLHQAWQHGGGVVWGLGVATVGKTIRVAPGLAVDAAGRDLPLDDERRPDLAGWLADTRPPAAPDGSVLVDVVARAAVTDTDLAPVPADPADGSPLAPTGVFSRQREGVEIDLAAPAPTARPSAHPGVTGGASGAGGAGLGPYHRVRVLFGLERVAEHVADPDGAHAAAWAERIARMPAGEQPAALRAALGHFAALDVIALATARTRGPGEQSAGPAAADVVLARVRVRLRAGEIVGLDRPDFAPRASILPTGLLQELLCGRGPALDGLAAGPTGPVEPVEPVEPAGPTGPTGPTGPRAIRDSVRWDRDRELTARFDKPLWPGTADHRNVHVASLGRAGGWVSSRVEAVDDDRARHQITIRLSEPPAHGFVRVLIEGTGPRPVLGEDGAPVAGVTGSAPRGAGQGGDAVLWVGTADRPHPASVTTSEPEEASMGPDETAQPEEPGQ